MPEPVVIVNTSPLLYLHQVDKLDILPQLYGQVLTPTAVQQELNVGKQQGVDVPNLSALTWLTVKSVASTALIPAVVDLGPGETEVLALGLEMQSNLLVFDDQLARQIASLYRLKYTGTLGVLIKAKQQNLIPNVQPVLEKLQKKGMWLSQAVITEVLKLSGEIS